MNIDYNLLEEALYIATTAHAGQVDKAGMPYILHPIRVADKCRTLEEKIVALLHDVIEDTSITEVYLESKGFPKHIIDSILSVTRRDGESYEDFIKRAKSDTIGREVKIHDLEDNMDITRLPSINETDIDRLKKYHKSYRFMCCDQV